MTDPGVLLPMAYTLTSPENYADFCLDFRAVHWGALGATVPAMFALTFFGILHVPINVPALALMTGEDNIDVDGELRAHGWSNALSGLCGSIQVCILVALESLPQTLTLRRIILCIQIPCFSCAAEAIAESPAFFLLLQLVESS